MKTSLFQKIAMGILLLPVSLWIVARALFLCALSKILRDKCLKSEGFDVICISHVNWIQHIWQRNHHTMSFLSKKRKVLYCYPITAHVAIKRPQVLFPWGRKRYGNLVFCKIFRLSGENHCSLIRKLNRFVIRTELNFLVRKYGLNRYILWYYFPFLEYMSKAMNELITVYDIQDDYSAFEWSSRNIVQTEKTLLRTANMVFTGTHALYEKHKPENSNIHFFPCGVEFNRFSQKNPEKIPEDIKEIKPPILGYFGLIDNRIDGQLLKSIAEKHPGWNIFMIGPVDETVTAKIPCSNIHYVGKKDYKILPYYLQKFDVCLMPFAINEITKKINPTKTLEYFSAGKPVVSTAIPDMIRYYGDIIGIATTPGEFEELCKKAVERPGSFAIEKGIEIARKTSWESIVGSMENLIEKEIKKTGRNET